MLHNLRTEICASKIVTILICAAQNSEAKFQSETTVKVTLVEAKIQNL